MASVTGSADFPGLLPGSYRGGSSDGLVTSLDSSLSRVRWTTLLGGTGADAAYSLQREDAGGGLLVAGGTTSPALAGATGGYQTTPGGGVDGFVARLLPGGALLQSTYLGTSAYDQAFFVRQGAGGQVYVLGQTLAPAWPGLDATRYHTAQGQQFIQQLASDLRSAGFATVFGSGRSTTDISPTAFGVDCYGRILLAGWGGGLDPNSGATTGLPVTANAFQNNTDGQDFYLMQLSDGARVLDYATFFGTSADDHVDGGTSRFDAQGILYQAVCACDQGGAGVGSLPVPPGAFTYAAANGAPRCNNAAFKFAFLATASPAGTDTLSVCARTGPVGLGGSPAGGTWTGPGVSGSVAGGFVFQPDSFRLGINVLTYTSPGAANGCTGISTRRITVLAQGRATASAPKTTFCLRAGVPLAAVALTGRPAGGTWRGRGVVPGTARFDPVLAGAGSHLITYEVSAGRCPVLTGLQMTVKAVPPPTPMPPRRVCLNDPPAALGGTPAGGIWTGPGVAGSIGSFVFAPTVALLGGPHILLYTFQGDADCDPVTDTLRMTVLPPGPTGAAPPDTAFCLSTRPVRLRGGLPLGGSWSGPGVAGAAATGFFFTPSPLLTGPQTLLYTGPTGSSPACPGRAQRVLTVNTSGVATVSVPDTLLCAVAGPQRLSATPTGGMWTGPGVSGTVAGGFFFTPTAALTGVQTLAYAGPAPANAADCPMAATLRLRVLALPPLLFAPVGDVSFCLTAPPHGIVLTATPAGGTFSGPGVVGNRFNPSDAGPGRHTLTYIWDFPEIRCPITITQTVNVRLVPAVRLPADTVLCASLVPLPLRASPTGGTWTGPGVTAAGLFTPPAMPGTTTLYYELPGTCDPAPYRVTVPAQLSAQARWTAPACAANARAPRLLRFEATGAAAGQVQWDFGDGTAPATGVVVEHRYAAAGRFQPLATLPAAPAGACPNQLTLPPVEVQAARVPNIITPNADGLNDTFAPELGGCPGRFQVFSRWGQAVFDAPIYHNDWDGAGLPAGLYYYLLHDTDGTMLGKGWVEIVR